MSYETLKESIVNAIRPNGNQEITGQLLQDTLVAMVDEMKDQDSTKATQTQVAQDIASAIAPLARQDGNYPQMSVGFAENIVGDGTATEEEFSFRPTAGINRNVETTTYDYDMRSNFGARIEAVKGNSVVWNQMNASPDFSNLSNISAAGGASLTSANGVLSITLGASNHSGVTDTILYTGGQIDHTYLLIVRAKANTTLSNVAIPYVSSYGRSPKNTLTTSYQVFTTIFKTTTNLTSSGACRTGVVGTDFSAGDVIDVNMYSVYDLTQMFGAGNEPTTVEEFYARLSKGVDLTAYNDGEIVNANYKAIKTTGFNQWDEQWELGTINGGTGVNSNDPQNIRCVNYIPALPNIDYYFHIGRPCTVTICCYDSAYNFLGKIAWGESINRTYKTLPNTSYIRFATYSSSGVGYGATYNNDICINIDWDEYSALNGQYKPYKPFVRDLSWIKEIKDAEGNTLFEDGLKQAGSDRDEIRFNSTTQKWEAVSRVGVRAYTSGDESDNTLTTDGTHTNYPLATPIVTEIDEIPNLDYEVADYGTEELIAPEGVKSAPFLGNIIYTPNALKTLEQVPDILRRLATLEAAVASATSTTNE